MSKHWTELHRRHDARDMYALVAGFADQMDDAWRIGREFAAGLDASGPARVVACGMGGSAIGADMAVSFLGNSLRVPMAVSRDYSAPAYYRDDSLVIISSYSGNTAETLSAYESLRGGSSRFIAITSGGKLAGMCERDGVPVCRIPGGMPPRSALGYSLLPTLLVLRACGAADFGDEEFDEARGAVAARIDECRMESAGNPATDIAEKLHGHVPFVYAGPGLLAAAARRWSCQFNENSKSLAHFAMFTELNHNEIVGWHAPPDAVGRAAVISLEDPEDGAGLDRQRDVGLGIMEPLAAHIMRIPPAAGGRLARMLSNVILGDFASVYLALLGGVDPTPVEKIDYLKSQL